MPMEDLSRCKILIVDDTKTNVDILVQALRHDYKLGVALDGFKALAYIGTNMPDLILLDIMMPGMDGFDVCCKLKEDAATRNIPIIFITAMDHARDKTKGFEIGAVDYITKPFDIAEVKARVKTHLSLKLAREELKNQNVVLEKKVRERTQELEETQIEIVDRLGMAAEYRDKETGRHIKRMSRYCRLLGKEAGLAPGEYELLSIASTMHDVGKIGISDLILLNKNKLTEDEWVKMRQHTLIGANLLSGSKSSLLQMAEIIAKTHHEKWDGTGYTQGLRGEEIPLFGRITCICDVFDAFISKRPYKEAWPVDRALEEISVRGGTHFDPHLVTLFLGLESEVRRIAQEIRRPEQVK